MGRLSKIVPWISSSLKSDNQLSLTRCVCGSLLKLVSFHAYEKSLLMLCFLEIGTTLEAGTAIMTGTSSGVGWFQKPQYSLKNGDVVEVEIEPIGVLRNTMKFE